MNFHIGKIYNIPSNFYFYKANQPRLWEEYRIKFEIPEKIYYSSCIEYYKNMIIFPENDDEISESDSDDDSWVDMKKYI